MAIITPRLIADLDFLLKRLKRGKYRLWRHKVELVASTRKSTLTFWRCFT